MTYEPRPARALPLGALAAIVLTVAIAHPAQAAPEFYRENVLIPSNQFVPARGEGGPFTLYVPALGFEIICNHESDETFYSNTATAKGYSKSKIELTECKVNNLASCTIVEPIVFAVEGQLLTHEGKIYTFLEPWIGNGGTIAVLDFLGGGACALPSEVQLKGSTMNKMISGESVNREIEFSQAFHTLVCSLISPCGLKFKTSAAFLEGDISERLGIPYVGENWGAK